MEKQKMFQMTQQDAVIFTDTLRENAPYISRSPRDHESLFVVTNGNLLYRRDGESAVVKKGQIGYIARGSRDYSGPFSYPEVSYIAVNFRFDRISDQPQPTLPFPVLCSEGRARRYEGMFREALEAYRSAAPGYEAVCGGLVLQIIGYLYQEHSMAKGDGAKLRRLAPAVEFLRGHMEDPELRIGRLAALCKMSEKQFRRVFYQVYGSTPYMFLQEYRIRQAETLLRSTGRSVSEIALACGFSDVFSFSHCFKRHRGVSPAEYRAR